MNEFLLYQLKAALCLAVFYLFFKGMLSRETFHRFNRILLLSGIVAAFVLPVWVVTLYRELPVFSVEDVSQPAITPMDGLMSDSDLLRRLLIGVLFWTAIAGVGVTLLRWGRSLGQVVRTIRRGRRERLAGGGILVRVAEPVAPFSWMHYIVISEPDLADNGSSVLLHEQAHLRFGHSWDLLFADLLCCLQWFNPAMWLLRRELRALHEYEADAAVLAAGTDPRSYQLLLIRKAVGGRWYSAANSFNHSKLKNRIDMMLRERSSRRVGARALLLVPLLGIAVGAFAQTVYRKPEPVYRSMQTVVVKGDSVVVNGVKEKPLILVDGVATESFDDIDAAGIESVSVLKGESAVTTYGDRGKNGVIVVTRKEVPSSSEYYVTVSSRSSDSLAAASYTVKSGDGSEIYVTGVKTDPESGDRNVTSASQQSRMVITTRKGQEEPGMEATVITTMSCSDAAEIAAKALESSREALAESRAASKEGMKEARAALKESRKALEEARKEIDKALAGRDEDASISMGGEGGSVKISGLEVDGRLILIDGQKASQKEMNRTLRRKVQSINIWKSADAVQKFGDEGRNGVIEIVTRK